MVLSTFRHRTFVFSPSWFRYFTVSQSYFRVPVYVPQRDTVQIWLLYRCMKWFMVWTKYKNKANVVLCYLCLKSKIHVYSILFYSILFYSILFYSILWSTVFRLDNRDFLFCRYPRCTMVRWWKRNGTMTRWWKDNGAMVKSRWYDGTMAETRWYTEFSSSYHRVFTIVQSCFHHRVFIIAPSCFTIIPSRFHHCTIAFSLSYHRVFYGIPLGPLCYTLYMTGRQCDSTIMRWRLCDSTMTMMRWR